MIEAAFQDPAHDFHIPALCDVEVAAAVRGALHKGLVAESRAREAIDDFLDLPLTRHGHRSLLGRVLELRQNFSAYDATYVALAERIGASLITGDGPLAAAVRAHVGASVPILD